MIILFYQVSDEYERQDLGLSTSIPAKSTSASTCRQGTKVQVQQQPSACFTLCAYTQLYSIVPGQWHDDWCNSFVTKCTPRPACSLLLVTLWSRTWNDQGDFQEIVRRQLTKPRYLVRIGVSLREQINDLQVSSEVALARFSIHVYTDGSSCSPPNAPCPNVDSGSSNL